VREGIAAFVDGDVVEDAEVVEDEDEDEAAP
jgi:hypothetical protein